GRDDDRVLAVGRDGDERGPGRDVDALDEVGPHPRTVERREQEVGGVVVPEGADERRPGTARARRADGLVRALAAGVAAQVAAEDRLAAAGVPGHVDDEVDVRGPHDDDLARARHRAALRPVRAHARASAPCTVPCAAPPATVASATVRAARSTILCSPPGSDVAIRPSRGPVQRAPMPSTPRSAPTTPPTVAPAESVSQPAVTAIATPAPKSPRPSGPRPAVSAYAITGALLSTCTQCRSPYAACRASSPARTPASDASPSRPASRPSRIAAARRLPGGTTASAASSTSSTVSQTIAADASAAAHIAPYTPLRVWLSRASVHASRAASRTSPGETQPSTSVRMRAPIHSRNGLWCVAVSGTGRASRTLRYAARSAVNTRPAGSASSQSCATSSVVKPRPCFSSRASARIG